MGASVVGSTSTVGVSLVRASSVTEHCLNDWNDSVILGISFSSVAGTGGVGKEGTHMYRLNT